MKNKSDQPRQIADSSGDLVGPSQAIPRIEEALGQQNILKLFIKQAPVAVAMFDNDMRYLVYSDRWLADFGFEQQSLVGHGHHDVCSEVDERRNRLHMRCMRSGTETSNEEFFVCRDGRTEWFRWEAHLWRTDEGQIGGVMIFSEIITERKKTEQALRDSEMWYRRLFESAKDGILILDAETGVIDDVNPSLVGMLGYTKEQFLGKKIWELGFFRGIIDNQDDYLELQRSNYIRYEDLPLETADSRRIYVEVVSNVYFVENKKVIQCNIRNITERKRIEDSFREKQSALIKSERRYRSLFDSMTEGFALNEIICDGDGRPYDYRFLEVNRAYEELTGLKREDVLHKTHKEVFANDDNSKLIELYGKVALTGEPVEFENYSSTLKRHYQVLAYCPVLRQFAVVFMDISKRKKIEEELRLSEKRQAILLESASALLETIEPQKIINEICGRTMELLDCQVFFNFLCVEERNRLKLNSYLGISEEDAQRIEWLDFGERVCGCVARDGECVIVEDMLNTPCPLPVCTFSFGKRIRAYCCHPLKTEEKIIGTISFGTTMRDRFTADEVAMMKAISEMVTVAMQREEWDRKLIESEKRLRLAQLSANIGVWELNPKTGVLFSTPELARLYGDAPLSFSDYQDLHRKVHPDDLARIEKEREDAISANRSFDIEFRINYSDTEIRWISAKGGAVYDKNGDVVRVFGVNADITVRKMAEEVLRRDKKTLERIVTERSEKLLDIQVELERSKRLSDIGILASTVAHELRNPLAAIVVSTAIVRRLTKNRAIEKHLANIDKMVNESDQIIDNLLFYSRLRPPHYENIAIYGVIEECIDNLNRQLKKNIRFKRNFDSSKDIVMSVDPIQMREVFHNLLRNAADAVPDDYGEVEISGDDKPEFINIRIKDNGHGVDARHMENIFDPFFTTKAKGTGLGLTVCKQILNLHHGSIYMDSEPGKGSTVTITLPKLGGSK